MSEPIKTTDTVFRILEAIQEMDGGRVTEIAEHLDVTKSTVHRHLSTLKEREYVVKRGDEYEIGLRFLDLGQYAKTQNPAYVKAESKVRELASETDERVQFIVEEHGQAVYVARETGEHAVETDPGIGKRVPLHATAAGKAILAHIPESCLEQIIDEQELPKITSNTITDKEELYEELEIIRDRGYSFNDQENIEGLRAVGVPLIGQNDEVIGALSVSGPTKRFTGDRYKREIPELLMGVANELELNIVYA